VKEPITFVCWKWKSNTYRQKFGPEHVNVWARGLKRCLKDRQARILCVTDDPAGVEIETYPLWTDYASLSNPSGDHLPSCYRRLKLFSSETTDAMGIARDTPVVWIDLDVVFIRDLRPMFDRGESFVGWRGIGSRNNEVYNGTIVMFRTGKVDHLWDEFDPQRSPRQVNDAGYFGSDQGWISYKMAGRAPGWWSLQDGMFSYSRDVRPARNGYLPQIARIVSFNGRVKPWDENVMNKYEWVRQYWR
jgi:hypothetical protein